MQNFIEKHGLKTGVLIFAVAVVSLVVQLVSSVSYLLTTSIVGYPQHDTFDGTVQPVQKVPDWVSLSSERYNLGYNSLSSDELMEIPYYDPEILKLSTDGLVWGNSDHDYIRNCKITYSVPYMGNYLLDGRENAGSHPAVDIKIPNNTPIYSIANGTVIKAVNQSSGFGNHIVIQHNNFPTLDNPKANETIYSSYSHLNSIFVSEGDTVEKGEPIAYSGSTGTATTPHLHFQIDTDDAPWHPFWPFTWQEASEAGLDFFSAVNAGLGKDKALSTTINPMKYVQKYLGDDVDYISLDITEEENQDIEENQEPEKGGEEENVEDVEVKIIEEPVMEFKFDIRSKYYLEDRADFSILLRDQFGKNYKNRFTGEIYISSANNLFTSKPSIANGLSFNSEGRLDGFLTRMDAGRDRIKLEYNGNTYYSDWFEIIDTNSNDKFSDLSENNKYYTAVTYLASENIISGYPDGTFKPDKKVNRVEALKIIFEGIQEVISEGDLPFRDVSAKEWYGRYLYTAYKNGIVDGYPDGTFRPSNTVNRAEFYKILFNGMEVDVNPNVEKDPFEDVDKDLWYASFIAYAKELGIIDPNIKKLHPEEGMSRGEVAYAMYKLMQKIKQP
ncbi:peptidoglycan DD-metalloendopeptidase family protein [Candidatus Peregrinibacteria bacterium]|nr:peptidoglycan DD-metalloendopeptidase family protein [Candidatus Peregrinibacteria bacterium]